LCGALKHPQVSQNHGSKKEGKEGSKEGSKEGCKEGSKEDCKEARVNAASTRCTMSIRKSHFGGIFLLQERRYGRRALY
jgi:hypothetical protein